MIEEKVNDLTKKSEDLMRYIRSQGISLPDAHSMLGSCFAKVHSHLNYTIEQWDAITKGLSKVMRETSKDSE